MPPGGAARLLAGCAQPEYPVIKPRGQPGDRSDERIVHVTPAHLARGRDSTDQFGQQRRQELRDGLTAGLDGGVYVLAARPAFDGQGVSADPVALRESEGSPGRFTCGIERRRNGRTAPL